jgi:uncharacterized protein
MAVVTQLNYYPIKSCGGISADRLEITPRGFRYDRQWMLVEPDGTFLTQRELPRMALIRPEIADGCLTVSAPAMPPLQLPVDQPGREMRVDIWRDKGLKAVDLGDPAGEWFSAYLGASCRLVRFADDTVRPVDPRYARRPTDQVGFADGYPFLLISEASLEDLNTRLDEPLPMNRFRPNIVVNGVEPYAEDTWNTVRIGDVVFDVVKPCGRCAITTTDQETAARGKEPLRTLAMYRSFGEGSPKFGQNLVHHAAGMLRVSDRLEILS